MEVVVFINNNSNEYHHIPTNHIDINNIENLNEQMNNFLITKYNIFAKFVQEDNITHNNNHEEGYYVLKNGSLIKKHIYYNNWGSDETNIEKLGKFLFLRRESINCMSKRSDQESIEIINKMDKIMTDFKILYDKSNNKRKDTVSIIRELLEISEETKGKIYKIFVINNIFVTVTNTIDHFSNNISCNNFKRVTLEKIDELFKQLEKEYYDFFNPLIYKQILNNKIKI
mgnify:FL=1